MEDPKRIDRNRRILRNVTLLGIGLSGLFLSQRLCIPTAVIDGVWVEQCPSGDLRQSVFLEVNDLQRNRMGDIKIRVNAHYTLDDPLSTASTFVRLWRTDLALVYPDGETTRALEVDRWNLYAGTQAGRIRLPRVVDGDYTLRATVRSAIGEQTINLPLPLYAPARVHVLTDRPLYEPGNQVLFRAVVLRAHDMVPLAERPGKWVVRDPNGTVLLEEKTMTDEWGVAAGSFPLDTLAESGGWTVRFESGGDSGGDDFQVEPFTLPRFQIEATPDAPFYARGDTPTIKGQVTYSSGAPVAAADLEINWRVVGAWPAPTEWQESLLPKRSKTDRDGTFTLTLPMVPADLRGQVSLVGGIAATDAAGDRVTGAVSALLSEDQIAVSAITELGDGLVEGTNNRLYLRVTTADGRPLPGATVNLRRSWDKTDKGKDAVADADGVAAIQIDPGAAVNVVIPPMPSRPPPRKKAVRREGVYDMLSNREATLAERLAIDPWIQDLEPCARFISSGSQTITLGLSVAPGGRLESITRGETRLEQCAARTIAGRALPAADRRMMRLQLRFTDPDLPTVSVNVDGARQRSAQLTQALNDAALDARACLPEDAPSTALPHRLIWETQARSQRAALRWADRTEGTKLSRTTVACLERTLLSAAVLPDKADQTAMGVVNFRVNEADRYIRARPQATTMLGYELSVTASLDDKAIGDTLLRLSPGQVPPLRIRAEPVIARPGEDVTFTFLRSPDFIGELPEAVSLQLPDGDPLEAALEPKARTATFTLPEDAEGWYTVRENGAVARVYVPDQEALNLALSTDSDRYAPGDEATISVQTTNGQGSGVAASVGLFGVDETLGQLAPLPGPDAMAADLMRAPTLQPAFGVFEGQALMMGRIQGENAIEAAVLKVTDVPSIAEADRSVSGSMRAPFDPLAELTDSFYVALAELYVQVRAWEDAAGEADQLTPPVMAKLWEQAIDACEARGEDVTDAYRRPLALRWLPDDLLALTDPREVVMDGARLPEDVENWIAWVREEQP